MILSASASVYPASLRPAYHLAVSDRKFRSKFAMKRSNCCAFREGIPLGLGTVPAPDAIVHTNHVQFNHDVLRRTTEVTMRDAELDSMIKNAVAAYEQMTPEQKYEHDRAQAISFVYGNVRLDGIDVAEEQVAATWDKNHYPFGLKMFTAGSEEFCIATSPEDAAKCYEEAIGASYAPDGEPVTWTEMVPDKTFKFMHEDGSSEEKTRAQWVREHGRGYFASANV